MVLDDSGWLVIGPYTDIAAICRRRAFLEHFACCADERHPNDLNDSQFRVVGVDKEHWKDEEGRSHCSRVC